MPTIKRYISNDGTEHADVAEMRAHEIVNDVALALTATMDDVRGWMSGGAASPAKRDALLRVAVRVGRARPADQKKARITKPKAASEAGTQPSVDASGAAAIEVADKAA